MKNSYERFKNEFSRLITRSNLKTKYVDLESNRITVVPGYHGGSHGPIDCWVLTCRYNKIKMFIGFYKNFTPFDLWCKVCLPEEINIKGLGATVQFNMGRSLEYADENFKLIHRGIVTIRNGINRSDLLKKIIGVAPSEAQLIGLVTDFTWPFIVGKTNNLSGLLDRLFLYLYCVEQAKRKIKKEALLPKLNDVKTILHRDVKKTEVKTYKNGQGVSSDPIYNKLIELYAMKWATKYYKKKGYFVDDVSEKESFDLHCKKRSKA